MTLSVFICVHLWLVFLSSCATKPTDMRTLVPAETLVYLETNDLAAALQPIVDAKPFVEAAKRKPDLSALKGVQLAVAVTGFETSEEKLTDEHSVGRVQPRFVAIADTHAWNSNAVTFAEKKLGSFVASIYDSEPTVEKTDKSGGKYFTWTATDGRKAYALVIESIIYFGNDEPAIEKCLAVKRGETDSILKTGKIQLASPAVLGSGYVSTDGIAQIAALAGLKFASEAADESEVQSAIAGILPQLIRNSITDVSWTSVKTEKGIEDRYTIGMPADITAVFAETMEPSGQQDSPLYENMRGLLTSVTIYNLKDPQLAWRSALLVAQKHTDPLAGKIIGEFSGLLAEPYGIRDPELFLSGVGPSIVTALIDVSEEKPILIASVKDLEKVKKSLLPEIKPLVSKDGEPGIETWILDEDDYGIAFVGNFVYIGNGNGVIKCLTQIMIGVETRQSEILRHFGNSSSEIRTVGSDKDSAAKIADILSAKKAEDLDPMSFYSTETRFTKTGIDRRTTSDFGLIGSIIAQLGGDE